MPILQFRGAAGALSALAMVAAALTLSNASLAAQEREVVREVYYNFFDSNLAIRVDTEAEGQLRLIRGRRNRVEVAGRAADGIASFGFDNTGRRELALTALGSASVDFVVVVPEDVRVHVLLPGLSRSQLFGSMRESATYAWHAAGADRASIRTYTPPAEPQETARPDELDDAYRGATPLVLSIPRPATLSSVSVRIQGSEFRIRSDGPVRFRPTGNDLVLDDAQSDARIVVSVPPSTSRFTLRMGGADALRFQDGFAEPLCEPVTEQYLDGGRSWFTFSPADGMTCESPRARRGTLPRT